MNDLKYIKDHYGEKMMKLCRDLFPTILETPGNLSKIMGECFHPSKSLYYDIVNNKLENQFEDYINKKIGIKQVELPSTNKTPFELMEEAGYKLYKCETEEEIQAFRKYYDKRGQKYDMCRNEIPRHVGEELCTFDGGRLESCHVFFAVKKEAEKLKREDFKNPIREDEYGTSVISIQFSKYDYILSIKNRYNHTVDNPDATFGNNLENIIPGLTKSFEEYYGHEIKQSNEDNFEIPNYVEVDGKFYKYNYESNNIYYCPDNIIIKNGTVITEYNEKQEQYIIMDYFILDLKAKTLTLVDETIRDSFINEYKNIEKIGIKKTEDKKVITIITKDGSESKITINNQNQIIEYENNQIEKTEEYFFNDAPFLIELKMPNVKAIGNDSFQFTENLKKIDLAKLKSLGVHCFNDCSSVEEINLPELAEIEEQCFFKMHALESLNLPSVKKIGRGCFWLSQKLRTIDLPRLKSLGNGCFNNCPLIQEINLPEIIDIDMCCFDILFELEKINMPKLEKLGEKSFNIVGKLENIYLPKIKIIKDSCFINAQSLQTLFLPELEELGNNCFRRSEKLTQLYLPKLQFMNAFCFAASYELERLELPELKEMESYCFMYTKLKEIYLPKIETIRTDCFEKVGNLKCVDISKLRSMENSNIPKAINCENNPNDMNENHYAQR